jgi:hypothetical protein
MLNPRRRLVKQNLSGRSTQHAESAVLPDGRRR